MQDEQYNLAWLCMAMTLPLDSEDKAHYDKPTKTFFYYSDTDLFFTDELVKDVLQDGFTKEVEAFLVDRHEKIEKVTWDILQIPKHRLLVDPLSDLLGAKTVIQKAREYALTEQIDLATSRIMIIDVNNSHEATIKRWERRISPPWWKFW